MSAFSGEARLAEGPAAQPVPVDPTGVVDPIVDDQGATHAAHGLQLVGMTVAHTDRRPKRVRFAEGAKGLYRCTLSRPTVRF